MRDFADEVPGYLNNKAICRALEKLELASGPEAIPENLRICYRALVAGTWIAQAELPLLEAWIADLASLTSDRP